MEIVYSFDLLILMVTLTSVVLQVYLFFTVIFKSPQNMSQYRYFLCLFTFWDCFYNITVGLILCPEILLPAPAVLAHGLAMELVELFGHGFSKILGSMILWGGADVVQLQTYCLMYRFCAIHPNPKLLKMFMSWPGLIAFHILGYAIVFSVAVPAYICILDDERTRYFVATLSPASLVNKGPRTPVIFVDMHCPILYEGFVATAYIALRNNGIINISTTVFNAGIVIITLYPATNALICIVFITPYWNFTKQWISWILYKLRIIKEQWGEEQRTVVMLTNVSSMTYVG